MKNTPLPKLPDFIKLTGRIWRHDLNPVFRALEQALAAPRGAGEAPAVRALRRECIRWMRLPMDTPQDRRCLTHVKDLLRRATKRYNDLVEAGQLGTFAAPPVPQIPPLPTLSTLSGAVPRVGNTMRDKYRDEMASPHWTPKVHTEVSAAHQRYLARGGRLPREAFARLVLGPSLEDDPERRFLLEGAVRESPGSGGSSPSARVDARAVLEGVRYCDEEERREFQVHVRGGVLFDADSIRRFDTQTKQVSDYGYGWGMFVLGFDDVLYVESEARDYFHHSSFFAGGPVQCAGELCCVDGAVRFLTAKAGHYRSGLREFRQVLRFLSSRGVDLAGVLVVTEPKERPYSWFSAQDVLTQTQGAPLERRKRGVPSTLLSPGIPTIIESPDDASG